MMEQRENGFHWPAAGHTTAATLLLVVNALAFPWIVTGLEGAASWMAVSNGLLIVFLITAGAAMAADTVDRTKDDPQSDLPWCRPCGRHVACGTKHCWTCNRCTRDFDHHCPWLNCCVGADNYRLFVASSVTLCLYLILVSTATITQVVRRAEGDNLVANSEQHFPGLERSVMHAVGLSLVAVDFTGAAILFQLGLFHVYLRLYLGVTTYEFICQVRGTGRGRRASFQTSSVVGSHVAEQVPAPWRANEAASPSSTPVQSAQRQEEHGCGAAHMDRTTPHSEPGVSQTLPFSISSPGPVQGGY
mmetsp:Transcript_11547/g.25634  ORF Transcript_11547/g.25634 Transcript_11547/m.25634 type:complete len:303 (-) Transcript_11547:269-1177(-)